MLFKKGNMFREEADVYVNPVNCVGVMGKGLALSFKLLYPKMFKAYVRACNTGWLKPGRLHVYRLEDGKIIINFPTKRHWRQPSNLADVEAGLKQLKKLLKVLDDPRTALPALGCGNGGLGWEYVRKLTEHYLGKFKNVVVFEPMGEAENLSVLRMQYFIKISPGKLKRKRSLEG